MCSSSSSSSGADGGSRTALMLVDTSGHNCAEWKGDFYPERFSAKRMLPFYAERSPTVEINYTFYRMPTARLLDG